MSPSCASTATPVSTGPHFVIANVSDQGDGTYALQYDGEQVGTYDLHVGLAVPGGLSATYYDNLWLLPPAATQRVDPTVNWHWGDGVPITTYAASYVSAKWEGRLRPPITGTIIFYSLQSCSI